MTTVEIYLSNIMLLAAVSDNYPKKNSQHSPCPTPHSWCFRARLCHLTDANQNIPPDKRREKQISPDYNGDEDRSCPMLIKANSDITCCSCLYPRRKGHALAKQKMLQFLTEIERQPSNSCSKRRLWPRPDCSKML